MDGNERKREKKRERKRKRETERERGKRKGERKKYPDPLTMRSPMRLLALSTVSM